MLDDEDAAVKKQAVIDPFKSAADIDPILFLKEQRPLIVHVELIRWIQEEESSNHISDLFFPSGKQPRDSAEALFGAIKNLDQDINPFNMSLWWNLR